MAARAEAGLGSMFGCYVWAIGMALYTGLERIFSMAVTEQDVLSALRSCYDPEIPVNIVDLGLIYQVNFAPAADDNDDKSDNDDKNAKQDVTVDMTLTAQGCPEHVNISAQVKSRLEQLPGVRNCTVNVVWTPAWTPERLSPEARKQLGIE
jgi:metal-sulfur cluster biosynthetic enzyme